MPLRRSSGCARSRSMSKASRSTARPARAASRSRRNRPRMWKTGLMFPMPMSRPKKGSNYRVLKRHMMGAGATFDGGGIEPVDLQDLAQQLQQAKLFLGGVAIGRGHIAGDGIGRFAQLLRQG